MNPYQNRLDAAVAAARQAGEYLLSQPSFSVSHKQSNDYVTDCDRGSEKLIRDLLLTAFPEDGFLGEEDGERKGSAGRWIVDPIDGTTNFICDLPLYTISIAYEEAGELVVGCVYCPRLNEMFTAMFGAIDMGGVYYVEDGVIYAGDDWEDDMEGENFTLDGDSLILESITEELGTQKAFIRVAE